MIYNDYREAGGEKVSLRSEVAGLRAAGHDVHVFEISNTVIEGSGHVIDQARTIFGGAAERGRRDQLIAFIGDLRPDIVHCQNLFPLLARPAITALRRLRVPYVRHLRNYRARCLGGDLWRDNRVCLDCNSARNGLPGVVHQCYRNSTLASAGSLVHARIDYRMSISYPPDAYIAVSQAVQRHLALSLLPDVPCYVKPNAVGVERSTSVRSGFLFVGRLESHKGWSTVCRIAAKRPQMQFTIIGDGPDADVLRTWVARTPNLKWETQVSHSVLMRRMAESLALIVPSWWDEPFGRVAAESLGTGTPCLVPSASGGLSEIVDGLDEWLRVDASDGERGWIEAIDRVGGLSSEDYAHLSNRCTKIAETRYSVEKTTEQLVGIYSRALTQTRRNLRSD